MDEVDEVEKGRLKMDRTDMDELSAEKVKTDEIEFDELGEKRSKTDKSGTDKLHIELKVDKVDIDGCKGEPLEMEKTDLHEVKDNKLKNSIINIHEVEDTKLKTDNVEMCELKEELKMDRIDVDDVKEENFIMDEKEAVKNEFNKSSGISIINGKKRYHCEICNKSFCTMYNCRRHVRQVHSSDCKSAQCSQCGQMFRDKHDLKLHEKVTHQLIKLVCEDCGKQYSSKGGLQHHRDTAHSKGFWKFLCGICDKKFNSKQYYMDHMTAHSGLKKECLHCNETFTFASALKNHMNSVHSNRKFMCNLCPKEFKGKRYLAEHVQSCHCPPKYMCGKCGKRFKYRSSRNSHKCLF